MIDILLPEAVAAFDISQPPGPGNPTSGMGMKYARVAEALSSHSEVRRVSRLDDVLADFVFVDAVWFNVWNDFEKQKARAEEFICKGFRRVLLAGSDQSLSSWPAAIREIVLPAATWVTHNTEYLRKLFFASGVYHSRLLCDPVPEHVFFPMKKEPRVYASGQISWEKRTQLLVDCFLLARDLEIETVYIGSATTWGDALRADVHAYRYRLEQELRGVTDVFLGNVPQSMAAYWANASMHHLHVAEHDVSSQIQQEAALGGAVLWGMHHPINAERPVFRFSSAEEWAEAVALCDAATSEIRGAEVRRHAQARWSYEAFRRQFEEVCR